jgi:hypothetical protein
MGSYEHSFDEINFGKALCASNIGLAEHMMEKVDKVMSWVVMLADSVKLPEHVRDADRFKELVSRLNVGMKDSFPVPIMSPLPSDMYTWNRYITMALEDVNSRMFAIVTEAYGANRKMAKEVDGKIHELHSEDRDMYAMVQVVENGKGVRTFAAPIIMCLVNKQGDYKQKIGDWQEYLKVEKLAIPTKWNTR